MNKGNEKAEINRKLAANAPAQAPMPEGEARWALNELLETGDAERLRANFGKRKHRRGWCSL